MHPNPNWPRRSISAVDASEEVRRLGLQLHDTVVQGLATAKLALDLHDEPRARDAVEGALEAARQLVSELLGQADLRPGHLASDDAG
jgi:signal transduction histidine kinase